MTPGYLIPSPLGDIFLRAEDDFLTGLFFVDQNSFPSIPFARRQHTAAPLIHLAQEQIAEFFAGERCMFTVPFRLRGTPFQRRVWKELAAVPYGAVVSYATIARRMGLGPGYAGAVRNAIGRNPISVIVPCHRVVSASGDLTGYAGGIERKKALLTLEKPADMGAPINLLELHLPL
ncbi:methylated-DNA--[protein]-cysteine S-methyltransferase [Burkholderia gladioli]|uniref:methylated-DNA--[protein]-cysteine S-methyltransferase n=1 Tax=Burkholderia gladioli TaxID=28095 RepID=UPI002FE179E9